MWAMSRGDYDGLVAANEPPAPKFSPRVLKNYSNMTTSEFSLIKLDTHLQSRALLQLSRTTSCKWRACWCRAIANF